MFRKLDFYARNDVSYFTINLSVAWLNLFNCLLNFLILYLVWILLPNDGIIRQRSKNRKKKRKTSIFLGCIAGVLFAIANKLITELLLFVVGKMNCIVTMMKNKSNIFLTSEKIRII